jgi:hypothetical protein
MPLYIIVEYSDVPQINPNECELNTFLTLVVIMKCRHWEDVLGPSTPELVKLLARFEVMFSRQFPKLMI